MPLISTESPTATVGVELVKTKIPSLVAGSVSGFGSCIQKPLLDFVRSAVTTPGTFSTVLPSCGETQDVPWMSWMRSGPGPLPPPPAPEFSGVGAATVKSAALSSVSGPVRCTDVALVVAAAAVPSCTTAPPQPTRSTMDGSAAQSAAVLQVSAVVEWTSATVPAIPLMLIAPVASGVGSAPAPVLVPPSSSTRKCLPAGAVPDSGVTCQVVVAPGLAEMYCTDQPVRLASEPPAFCNSTKSLASGAPELPPPPYASLINSVVDGAADALIGTTARPMPSAAVPARARAERARTSSSGGTTAG